MKSAYPVAVMLRWADAARDGVDGKLFMDRFGISVNAGLVDKAKAPPVDIGGFNRRTRR